MMEVSSFFDLLVIIFYVLTTGFLCVGAAMFISKVVEPDREEREKERRERETANRGRVNSNAIRTSIESRACKK